MSRSNQPLASNANTVTEVVESARRIPVIAEVDVVVAGGSCAAVSAALAAAGAGARVMLVANEPYLGADLGATYRLWPETRDYAAAPLARALFAESPPSPLHIKATLTRVLLKAGVNLLLESFITEALRDAKGDVAGVVIGNRSGRQAVVARTIIDATPRSTVARLAGAKFGAYPAGTQHFSRMVIGGEPPKDAGEEARPGPGPIIWEKVTHSVYEYTLDLPMADGSFRSLAMAEQQARDLTWRDGQAFGAEELFQVPPAAIRGQSSIADWPGAGQLDLDALRPQGVAWLLVLGGCADVSRAAAERMLAPVASIQLGQRVGLAAAVEARGRDLSGTLQVAACPSEGEVLGGADTHELLTGFPGQAVPQRYVEVAASTLPVLGQYDVVVVGGGTAGAAAAIGAARLGAKVLVLEYLHLLGGTGTVGMISKNWYGNVCGFTAEVDGAVASRGPGMHQWNIEQKAEWLRTEIRKAGGEIWFGAMTCGVVLDGPVVRGVVALTPQGRGAVLAQTVIDATGNADVAAAAGAACRFMGDGMFALQGTGLSSRAPGQGYNNSDWTYVNDADAIDRTRMHVIATAKYQNRFDVSPLIASRERRSIVGEYTLTAVDIARGRRFADTIAEPLSNFDTHGYTIDPLCRLAFPTLHELAPAAVPFRCLLPRGLEGLLVTGIGISAHRDALPIIRMQPDIQNAGYAAGVAAALARRAGVPVRQVDLKAVQTHLIAKGCLKAESIPESDTPPANAEAVRQALVTLQTAPVLDGWEVMQAYAMILDAPRAASGPILQESYRVASRVDLKLALAEVLAILGDANGRETLLETLQKASDWDRGWEYQGMGNHGAGYSRLDSVILDLADINERRAVPLLVGKLKQLAAPREFSHFRAAALALEKFADPRAAAGLAELLRKPELRGHAVSSLTKTLTGASASLPVAQNQNESSVRERTLRELLLATALYACGDSDGLGQRILNQYAEDVHGVYRLYARTVLSAATARGK